QKDIPENEIAFIHDYNTRKQKEELFEAVNKGYIRIVLGSTKKLGTGVNVQTRCVAGHHLDISWRPADIEQRNGRFERQGNEVAKNFLDNKVTAYYYATERTLDASMYNTVSQKAKFIAQLKVTDTFIAQSTAKDIEEEIDMGSMAAELSGDPIFKEKATLQKRVDELKQLEKSFNSKRFDFEDKSKNSQKLVLFYRDQIIKLEKNIPLISGIPKGEKGEFLLKATLSGRSFDKISDLGTAIIAEAEHAKKYRPAGQKFSLGEQWGFKIIGKVEHDFFENRNVVERQIISPLGDTIGPVKRIADGVLAAALQIKQAILEMPKELERAKERFEIEKQNITEYAKKTGEEFPYKEELSGKQKRLYYINNEIINITKQNEEKDNLRGEITADRGVSYGAVKMRI
ncbi:MAG: helicase-related protein, partial [Chitinophagaceae bacterium]